MAYDEMTWVVDLPTYATAIIDVPARMAPVVFERWWILTCRRSGAPRQHVVDATSGRLTLDPATWARLSPGRGGPQRRVRGRLHVARRAWPVELELSTWSTFSSELGLQFTGRRFPKGRALVRYHQVASAVLAMLADELRAVSRPVLATDDLARIDAA